MKQPWLSANSDHYFKARTRVLVRDNFTCQFANLAACMPDPALYNPALYEDIMAQWRKLSLTPIEGLCTLDTPEQRLRLLQVHHIIERTNFRPWQIEGHDLSNLVTVCIGHHGQIHPHMTKVFEQGSVKTR